MDAVDQLEWLSLDKCILNIDPNHFSVIWINQVTKRGNMVPDQIISLIPSQSVTTFASILKGVI
jgi:hypothetical protein